MHRLLGFVGVLVGMSVAAPAARGDAWSVAERLMPGGMTLVVKVDVKAFRDIGNSKAMIALADSVNADKPFELLAECGVELMTVVDQVVLAVDENHKVILFASGRGLVAELGRCFEKEWDARPRRDGNLTRFVDGDRVRATIAVYDGVLVMDGRGDESILRRYIPGRGVARDALLARALNQINRSAPAFAVYAEPVELRNLSSAPTPSLRRLARRPADLLQRLRELTGGVADLAIAPAFFLFAQADPVTRDDDDDDDSDPGDVKLKYAALELTGGATLRLRVVGVTSFNALAAEWLRKHDIQEAVDKINGTFSIREDRSAVEMVVEFPRSVLERAVKEFD